MIEKISIEKDYLSGTESYTTKMKPENTVVGDVTVSLYDEDGKKVKDVFTQNIVMDWLKYEAYTNLYEKKYAVGRGGHYSSEEGFYNTGSDYNHNDFPYSKYLVLLNGEHTDDNPKKCLTTDALVGYGIRRATYSGESLTRGSYNPKESYNYVTEDGKLAYHMVFDFPTHAANGVITGIGFAPSLDRASNIQRFHYSAIRPYDSSYHAVPYYYTCAHWRNQDQTTMLGPTKGYYDSYTSGTGYPIYISLTSSWHSQSGDKKVCDMQWASVSRGCINGGTCGSTPFFYYNEKTGLLKMPYVEVQNQQRAVFQNTNGSKVINSKGTGIGFKYEEYNAQCIQTRSITGTYDFDFCSLFSDHGLRPESTTSSGYSSYIYVRTCGLVGDNLCVIARTDPSQYHFTTLGAKTFVLLFDLNGSFLKKYEITSTAKTTDYYYKAMPYGKNKSLIQCINSSGYSEVYILNNNLTGNLDTIELDQLNYGDIEKTSVFKLWSKTGGTLIGNHNEEIVYVTPPRDANYVSNRTEKNGGSVFEYPENCLQLTSYTRLPNAVTKTNTNTMKIQYDIVCDNITKSDYIEL